MHKGQSLASVEEVAEFLGIPVATLYQWRYRGKGPRSMRIGRWVKYRWEDVERWADEQAKEPVA